ncbi:Unknown protein sequence [Pseudomonas amygdali pv. morsprunorum]|nr:Unknown protein sequence [Pseudomonas amygdali pv. morsprunorum]
MGRYLRYVAISQVFQPRTLQTPHKSLLERINRTASAVNPSATE